MRCGESCAETAAGVQMVLVFSARKWAYHPHVIKTSVFLTISYSLTLLHLRPSWSFLTKGTLRCSCCTE